MAESGTVNIHGKEYKTVALRLSEFRQDETTKSWPIETEIISINETTVVIKATVKNADGSVIATGHAEEDRQSSHINQTSALENCETSAIGRALACFGLAGSEFASADEVANAIHQQSKGQTTGQSPPQGSGRMAMNLCPKCGEHAVIKDKAEYGTGWTCWKKAKPNPGCGAKFKDDPAAAPASDVPPADTDAVGEYGTKLKELIRSQLKGTPTKKIADEWLSKATNGTETDAAEVCKDEERAKLAYEVLSESIDSKTGEVSPF